MTLLRVSRVAVVAAWAWPGSTSALSTCTRLVGIASGGGNGVLNLDEIKVSLEFEPFNLTNPTIPIVAECSSGLETPIAMRNLLGQSKNRRNYEQQEADSAARTVLHISFLERGI